MKGHDDVTGSEVKSANALLCSSVLLSQRHWGCDTSATYKQNNECIC